MLRSELRAPIALLAVLAIFAAVLLKLPGYLASPEILGTVIAAQVIIAAVCSYKKYFFAVLMLSFLWAGIGLPLSGAWLQGRWIMLAVGALAGLAVYMKERDHHFGAIHLVSFFCVLSAVVSASVSGYPQEALLKSVSLFLLFLYGAAGARLAVPTFRPEIFFRRLLVACEIVTYVSTISYFVLRVPIFGNPNSLGAIMGVVIVPVMLWGFLCAGTVLVRRRLGFELCLALMLLMSSFSRAGIAAGILSCLLVCMALKQHRLILSGAVAIVAIAMVAAMFAPRPTEEMKDAGSESVTALFLYKGKPQQGLLGSRKGPWEQTFSVIRDHPWFGSGFGTSVTAQSTTEFELTRQHFIDSRMIREHGNSYLAILEWSGLLGVFPFYLLVGTAAWNAKRALTQLRRSPTVFSPLIPAAGIVVAGFIGAAFEDWLFAVGYYVCVFFWAMVFILADLTHQGPAELRVAELAGHTVLMPAAHFAGSPASQ